MIVFHRLCLSLIWKSNPIRQKKTAYIMLHMERIVERKLSFTVYQRPFSQGGKTKFHFQ